MTTTTTTTTTTRWGPWAARVRATTGRELHLRACEAYERGEHEACVEAFTRALEVDGRNQFALCGRALARLKLGDGEEALRDTLMCVRNAPRWYKAWYRRAQALEMVGKEAEALNAYAEAKRCETTGDASWVMEQVDEAIEKLKVKIDAKADESLNAAVEASEARRKADVESEDEEMARRRSVRRKKFQAKLNERKNENDALKASTIGMKNPLLSVHDANAYLDDLEDSDDSALEVYDSMGRARFIKRMITDFSSIVRRLRTSLGAKATTEMMCELRRYGNCQISLSKTMKAAEKLRIVAAASDACKLPYVVIPAWREATSPWPVQLAEAHESVQDVMWLLETVARVTTAAVYEDVGKFSSELDKALDPPLDVQESQRSPEPCDVSPSALVLASDEAFLKSYAEKTSALVRIDWLEPTKNENEEETLLEFSICSELVDRVDGEFITTDQLDPPDREGHGPDGESYEVPRPPRDANRTIVSFFLCPKSSTL
jgi:tetratricopeptide (TPR) repeat protein